MRFTSLAHVSKNCYSKLHFVFRVRGRYMNSCATNTMSSKNWQLPVAMKANGSFLLE